MKGSISAIPPAQKKLKKINKNNRHMLQMEKRQFSRVAKTIPIKINIPVHDADIVIQTLNLSCNGALCKSDRFIAPMTKVSITMLLPARNGSAAKKVSCKGVVVRIKEDAGNDTFNVGLFFNDIKDKERIKLEDYIKHYYDSPTEN